MHSPAQRFDAKPIARSEGGRPHAIPNDKGEHPMQPLDDTRAPAPVTFENYLSIGACSERRALGSEHIPQLHKIVNFAVEHNDITPVDAVHRLIAGSQIND